MIKSIILLFAVLLSACSSTEQKPMAPTLTEGTPVYRSDDPLRACNGSVDLGSRGRVVYVPVPLPLPPKPDVPKIKGKDLKCLSPTTQWELKNRDTILKEYISELEMIIKSTRN